MTNPERLRGSLYATPTRVLLVIRVVDPRPDLATSLRAARRPGTPTKVRRWWSVDGGRLRLSFEVLEPEPCRRRVFYVPAAGLDAFVGGCAVGIDTHMSRRRCPAGPDELPLWPTEDLRLDVLETLTEAFLDPFVAMGASPWLMTFGACGGIESLTTPDVAIRKPTSHPAQTWPKLPKSPLKAHIRRATAQGHR